MPLIRDLGHYTSHQEDEVLGRDKEDPSIVGIYRAELSCVLLVDMDSELTISTWVRVRDRQHAADILWQQAGLRADPAPAPEPPPREDYSRFKLKAGWFGEGQGKRQ